MSDDKARECPLCGERPGIQDGRWKVHTRWMAGEARSFTGRCPMSNKPVKK